MQHVYRLNGAALARVFFWPVGIGGLLAVTGFLWVNSGFDLLFSLRLLNNWGWLYDGLILGVLCLRDVNWQQAQVEYRHVNRLGRQISCLKFTLGDGFHFTIPVGNSAAYRPLVAGLPLEQAITRCGARIAGQAELPQQRKSSSQLELGAAAGALSYTAMLLAGAGFLMLANYRAHYADSPGRPWVLGVVGLLAAGLAWWVQRPRPQPGVALFISLLFLAACTFFCWSAGMSAALALGQARKTDFVLTEDGPQRQVWKSGGPNPVTLTINADRAHQVIHGPAPVTLIVSTTVFGISALTQDEYTRLVQLD